MKQEVCNLFLASLSRTACPVRIRVFYKADFVPEAFDPAGFFFRQFVPEGFFCR